MITAYYKLVYNFYRIHGISRLLILITNRAKKIFFIKKIIFKILEISKSKSKIVFIDVGANNGKAHRFFKKYFSVKRFDYILIEPNKFLKNKLNKLKKKMLKYLIKQLILKMETVYFIIFK